MGRYIDFIFHRIATPIRIDRLKWSMLRPIDCSGARLPARSVPNKTSKQVGGEIALLI